MVGDSHFKMIIPVVYASVLVTEDTSALKTTVAVYYLRFDLEVLMVAAFHRSAVTVSSPGSCGVLALAGIDSLKYVEYKIRR